MTNLNDAWEPNPEEMTAIEARKAQVRREVMEKGLAGQRPKSGHPGVTWNDNGKCWVVRTMIHGVNHRLGYFSRGNLDGAIQAVKDAQAGRPIRPHKLSDEAGYVRANAKDRPAESKAAELPPPKPYPKLAARPKAEREWIPPPAPQPLPEAAIESEPEIESEPGDAPAGTVADRMDALAAGLVAAASVAQAIRGLDAPTARMVLTLILGRLEDDR